MLAAVWRKTELALAGEPVGDMPFDALRIVARECALPALIACSHLEGFALDASGWRPATEEDLLLYCYYVAGTVGHLMALLMGVSGDEQDILDRACDLGIAFQLANIARDVAEDQRAGRCYLPKSWLAEFGLSEESLLEEAYRDKVAELKRRLAALSHRYERSAKVGAARLPFRSRWAVLAAAGIYGRIAREAATRSADRLEERVVTSRARKLACVAVALAESFRQPAFVSRFGRWSPAHHLDLV